MTTEKAGENQRKSLRTKGVLTMQSKQKQSNRISNSSEKEPFLRAQLTPKGIFFDGHGTSAIRAVSHIACVALIAIAIVAVVVLLSKSFQAESYEGAQRTGYSSQSFPEQTLEEAEINSFFEENSIALQTDSM